MTNNDSTIQLSKTDQAIAYMAAKNVSAYEAAQHFGINRSAISRRLALLAKVQVCPCCGQVIKGSKK